jgi:hypothetical protein
MNIVIPISPFAKADKKLIVDIPNADRHHEINDLVSCAVEYFFLQRHNAKGSVADFATSEMVRDPIFKEAFKAAHVEGLIASQPDTATRYDVYCAAYLVAHNFA